MGRSPDSDDDLGDDLERMHRRRSEAAARGGRAYLRLLQLAETRDSGQARRIAGFLAATHDGAAPLRPGSVGLFGAPRQSRPMLEHLRSLSTWLQSWASPEMGLWGVFGSALLSATILPGSSEVVLGALITAYPAQAWPGFWVALAGNLLGCLLTFGMGYAGREGYERFQRVQRSLDGPQMQRLQRWGPPALVLSFVPLAGDALVLAAGWLKLPLASSLAWIALGKAARYLLVVLGMQGLLSFA